VADDSEIDAIDVEDRLRRVYAAGRRPTVRQRLTHQAHRDSLLWTAGSAGVATAVVAYLRGRRVRRR
jgi:hypothetical protein